MCLLDLAAPAGASVDSIAHGHTDRAKAPSQTCTTPNANRWTRLTLGIRHQRIPKVL